MTDILGAIFEPVQRKPSADNLPPRHDSARMESANARTAFTRAESWAVAALESATVITSRALLIFNPHRAPGGTRSFVAL
jgi:hypothetical protein